MLKKDWKRIGFAHYVSSDGYEAKYRYTKSGYICYTIRDPHGKQVGVGGIYDLNNKIVGCTG